jgi:hypothetical protein
MYKPASTPSLPLHPHPTFPRWLISATSKLAASRGNLPTMLLPPSVPEALYQAKFQPGFVEICRM